MVPSLHRLRLATALVFLPALAAALALDRRAPNTSLVAPLSFPPDAQWHGIDGSWSTFALHIGSSSQPQQVHLLPSWASYQTWAILPQGCASASNSTACAVARGGIFDPAKSSDWHGQGVYLLDLDTQLGYGGNAQYGYDYVGLGAAHQSGLPPALNSTLAGVAVPDWYLGLFGLNPTATNLTSVKLPMSSYMSLLKDNANIPSLSFGYTAGARYREPSSGGGASTGTYASLTLGGYDTARIGGSVMHFNFSSTDARAIVVGLQSVSTESAAAANPVPVELLPDPVMIYLDSSVPQIWLPTEACEAFERELGLVYDAATDLYLVNSTLHSQLLDRNPNITFKIGTDLNTTRQPTLTLVLPYAAFDLTASNPYQGLANASTLYFPLRRAVNQSQLVMGRTFFQEAYLSVDYERGAFNLSQAAGDQTTAQRLEQIPPYTPPVDSGAAYLSGTSNGKLSSGAIAGIVVGAIAGLALVALLVVFLLRRRKKRAAAAAAAANETAAKKSTALSSSAESEKGSDSASTSNIITAPGTQTTVFPKAELDGTPSNHILPPLHSLLNRSGRDGSPGSISRSLAGTPASLLFASSASGGPGTGTGTESEDSGSVGHSGPGERDASTARSSALSAPGVASGVRGSRAHSDATASGSDSDHSGPHGGPSMTTAAAAAAAVAEGAGTTAAASPGASSGTTARAKSSPLVRTIHEMAGDMPAIKEKDGRQLDENEATHHRERVQNVVDTPPPSSPEDETRVGILGKQPWPRQTHGQAGAQGQSASPDGAQRKRRRVVLIEPGGDGAENVRLHPGESDGDGDSASQPRPTGPSFRLNAIVNPDSATARDSTATTTTTSSSPDAPPTDRSSASTSFRPPSSSDHSNSTRNTWNTWTSRASSQLVSPILEEEVGEPAGADRRSFGLGQLHKAFSFEFGTEDEAETSAAKDGGVGTGYAGPGAR